MLAQASTLANDQISMQLNFPISQIIVAEYAIGHTTLHLGILKASPLASAPLSLLACCCWLVAACWLLLHCWLAGWLLAGRLAGWLAGWLAGSVLLAGRLAGLLAG